MTRYFTLLLLALMVGGMVLPAPVAAQDDENPLLEMLATIPLAAVEDGALVTYGDFAAWHAATGIPRVPDLAAAEALPELQRAWWMFVMPRQVVPPSALGMEYMFREEMRSAYGFDVFAVDRYVATDAPPANITVLETALEPARVGDALLATGYEAEALDGGTFYRILDDFETALGSDLPRVGVLGALNRIAVLDDGTILIGRATEVVQGALDARQGVQASLAEDARFRTAANTLHRLSRSDVGALVGAVFYNGIVLGDPALILEGASGPGGIHDLRATLPPQDDDTLSPYSLAAFGTYRSAEATYLAVALVLLPGADAAATADVLRQRMSGYVSLATKKPLSERWTFDRAFAGDDGDLPVSVVVMRVDDPPPAEGERVNTAVLSWIDLIYRLDLGFLSP